MALSIFQTITAALMLMLWVAPVTAQVDSRSSPIQLDAGIEMSVSPECSVPMSMLYTTGALPNVASAVELKRPIQALALGSFPSGSFGSGPGTVKYTIHLQAELQRVLPGATVSVEGRRLPGEITAGAPEYITNTVLEVRPDLVIWSAGTQDALARVDINSFVTEVGEILGWLRSHNVDVVIVEPPYAAVVADDEHYSTLVRSLRGIAQRELVPVVLRYDVMRYLLGQQTESTEQHFRLHDLGRRCTPEYVARAVGASLARSKSNRKRD